MERTPEDEVARLEHERCEAISAGDIAALDRLLGDDLTHTHASGKSEDKASYLAAVSGRPRKTSRGDDLRVRVYGSVAVMTGTQLNDFPPVEPGGDSRQVELQVLQVWVNHRGDWKQVAFASSGKPRN